MRNKLVAVFVAAALSQAALAQQGRQAAGAEELEQVVITGTRVANRVFDKYPDPLPPGLNTTGATSFANLAPFGRSGRYVYGRVTFAF